MPVAVEPASPNSGYLYFFSDDRYLQLATTIQIGDQRLTQLNAVTAIQSAVENLAEHPPIGRRVEGQPWELVISYGQTDYVALYKFVVRLRMDQ